MPRRSPSESPHELRRRLWGCAVTDNNARLHGAVVGTRVYKGSCYVTVHFEDDTRRELLVVAGGTDEPLTPLFIPRRNPKRRTSVPVGHWFTWTEPDDLLSRDELPCGVIDVTVIVHTAERASARRRENAAWYFAEVLATTIDDVLEQELWPGKPADEQTGDVETHVDVQQLDFAPSFAVGVKVSLFVEDEQTALNLLAKLYLLLDSKHARYPELWQDVFEQRGVRDAIPRTFVVSGEIAEKPVPEARIPVRYFAPRSTPAGRYVRERARPRRQPRNEP